MHTRSRGLGLTAAAAMALFSLLGACGGNDGETATSKTTATQSATTSTTPVAETDAVTVKDFKFGPNAISVKVGTTVTWTNEDQFDHSVLDKKSNKEGPHFGPVAGQTTYTRSFDAAGEYPYYCGIHNSMTGTVIVTS